MRSLAALLDLDEGARLTSVTVPRLGDVAGSGVLVMHVLVDVRIPGSVAGQAIATYLPRTIATLGGVKADGTDWCVLIQHTTDVEAGSVEVADRALERALLLTGVRAAGATPRVSRFDVFDMRQRYFDSGVRGVEDWGILDLLLGLILDLTRNDLAGLVAEVEDLASSTEIRTRTRRIRLMAELRAWSTEYEGPEAGSN